MAKNGTIGAPPPAGRRHRRRNNSEAVTVAELTGEIPVVRDDDHHDETEHVEPTTGALRSAAADRLAEPPTDQRAEERSSTQYWSEPQPRWPNPRRCLPATSDRAAAPTRGRFARSRPATPTTMRQIRNPAPSG
ncbi:hypothetical protein I552_7031 [Mycobacterium xenopi 3993]|nr:hypothetical protein I552_7031 [Mycobacterium xenopi 3993]